jgi:hypothetical protein
MESGQKIPEDLEEGVKHFSDQLNTLLGNGNTPLNWRKERDVFINSCKKLVGASQDVIEHTDISYEDLATGVAESISSNDYPETLEVSKPEPTAPEAEPEQEDEPEEEAVEEEEEEVVAPVQEPVVEQKAAPVQETPAAEETVTEPQVEENKPDEEAAAAEETTEADLEESNRGRGGRGRGRGPRGERGAFRGERGAFRGERGERGAFRGQRGDRPDRGDRGRGGRGRDQNWRGRNGEDNEGFITVKEDGENFNRGRGRGNRGFRARGERGAWRGSDEPREGASRGGPRPPRGDRPPRTRANNNGGDLPGVASAVTEQPETKE